MNERIKLLVEQAGFFMTEKNGQQLAELAELIVKECCDIIETDLATNKVKAETDNEGRIWVNAQLTFSELIKRRFGVEE